MIQSVVFDTLRFHDPLAGVVFKSVIFTDAKIVQFQTRIDNLISKLHLLCVSFIHFWYP